AVDADAPVEVEHGPGGRAAVAGEARLPGAGEGRDDPGAGVDAPDPVHLRFGEEDGAVGGQGHRAGFGQPGPGGRAAVAALARLAGAGDRADDPRAGVDDADLVVAGVGDDEVPGPVEDDALRPVDRGLVGRAAVAAVAVVAALADDRRDDVGGVVDPADDVVGGVGHQQVAVGRHGGGVGAAERGLGGRDPLTAEVGLAVGVVAGDVPAGMAGDGGDDAVGADPADDLVEGVDDVHRPGAVERQHAGLVHLG